MGFTEVNSLDADVTVALGKTNKETGRPYPTQAEGYFLGSRTVESKRGDSKLHFLQSGVAYKDLKLSVGQNLGIWGTTDLNRKLSQVTPGTMVRITSTGTKPTPNGDMYTYRVETDKTNTIEVSASTDNAAPAAEYDDGNDEEQSFEDVNQNSAISASQRKAEVEEILQRRGGRKN